MADTNTIDIGGQSRRFRIAAVVTALFVLFAGVLAVAALTDDGSGPDLPESGDVDLGDGDRDRGQPFDESALAGQDIDSSILSSLLEAGVAENDDLIAALAASDATLAELIRLLDGEWAFDSETDVGDLEFEIPEELEIPDPPYDIDVTPEPAPGADVVVTVEAKETPVPLAVVTFDGEPVGITNLSGQVEATVPHVDELTVSARPPAESQPSSRSTNAVSGVSDERLLQGESSVEAVSHTEAGTTGPAVGHLAAGAAVPSLASNSQWPHVAAESEQSSNSSVTYEISNEVSATPQRVAFPGEAVPVRFTINGTPVAGVEAIVDSETAGVTDQNGTVRLQIPEDTQPGESVPVTLQRGAFTGTGAVPVGEVDVDIDTGLLAFPGMSATAEVALDDGTRRQPLPGARVTLSTDAGILTEGVTDDDGVTTFTLPWASNVTASTTVRGETASATQSGLFTHLVLAVGFAVVLIGGGLVWLVRNPRRVKQAQSTFVAALITGGSVLRSVCQRLYAGGVSVRHHLATAGETVRKCVGHTLTERRAGRLRSLLGIPVHWAGDRLRRLLVWLVALPHRLAELVTVATASILSQSGESEPARQPAETDNQSTAAVEQTAEEPQSAEARLRQCWQWLVRRVVGGYGGSTKTAVEIEQHAVEQGLPAVPVRRLRRAFQQVEYGFTDAEDQLDTAETAIEQLQSNADENTAERE